MPDYGLTPAGFVRKPLATIVAEREARMRSLFGESVDLSPEGPFGQLIGDFAGELDSVWQLVESVHANGVNPDNATEAALTALSALTKTQRKPATYSTGSYIAVGDATTVIPINSQPTNQAGDIRYLTTAEVTLATATAWAGNAVIATGAVRRHGGRVYVALLGGTTENGGAGPTITTKYPTTQVDGTVTWVYLGDGDASATVGIQATTAGPVAGPAFSLSAIGTPITGWKGGGNFEDVVLGNAVESDAALRRRRLDELHAISAAALEAIRGLLLKVTAITRARVFENPTDVVDADGMPAHSIEALVEGGTDAAIAASLFSTKAAGIATHGNVSTNVTDSQGIVRVIKHSRPAEIDIYADATLYVRADQFPADGAAQAAGKLVAHGDSLETGYDVHPSAAEAQLHTIPGVLDAIVRADVVAITGSTPRTSVVIGSRAKPNFDSSRTTVTVIPRSP